MTTPMTVVTGMFMTIVLVMSGTVNTGAVCRFKDTMINTVGHRTTEIALELGLLYNSSEALKVGLVDQLVPEDQVLTTATQTMTKWLAIPGM